MDSAGLIAIGAGLAVGLAAIGTGLAQGRIGSADVGAVADHGNLMSTTSHASDGNGKGHNGPLLMQRWEVKYVVDRATRTGLERDLRALMRPDAFAGNDGTYTVRSLYFDSPDYMAYHSKVSGDAVRHKLRTHIYTDDPRQATWVRLEVKSRILATIHKVACDVSRDEYEEIWAALQARTLPRPEILDSHPGVCEFFRLQKLYNMEPKVIVQYRRPDFRLPRVISPEKMYHTHPKVVCLSGKKTSSGWEDVLYAIPIGV